MTKRVAIGAIVAVLLVGAAVAAYFYLQSDGGSSSDSSSQTSSQTPTFNPQPTGGESFVATYTVKSKDREVTTGKIEVDAAGNSRYTGTAAGKEFISYSVNGEYISCTMGTCIKLASNNNQESIASGEYSYSEEDFSNFKSSAVYKGRDDCPAGTCDVWEVAREDTTTILYIDDKNRLSKLKGERKNGSSYTITYEYKDVTITPPEDVKAISIPSSSTQ